MPTPSATGGPAGGGTTGARARAKGTWASKMGRLVFVIPAALILVFGLIWLGKDFLSRSNFSDRDGATLTNEAGKPSVPTRTPVVFLGVDEENPNKIWIHKLMAIDTGETPTG